MAEVALRFLVNTVPMRKAQEYCHKVARSFRYGCDVTFADDCDTAFDLTIRKLGNYAVSDLVLPPHRFSRDDDHIRKDGFRGLSLYYLEQGRAWFVQTGTEVRLDAGQCILVDHGLPHQRHFLEKSTVIGLHMPRDRLNSVLPHPELAVFRPLIPQHWGEVLTRAMAMLRSQVRDVSCVSPEEVVSCILSLLALTLPPPAESMRGSRCAQLRRLRQTMSQRLHEMDLGPEELAAEEGISKRQVHALFNDARTTFSQELIAMRLGKARRLLQDERFRNHTVGQVASLCGFANVSHFGRRFKDAHGLSPAAYRGLMARGGGA